MVDIKVSHNVKIDKDGNCQTEKPIIKGDKKIVDDILDACKYTMNEKTYDYDKYILGIRKTPILNGVKTFFENMEKSKNDVYKYFYFSLEDEKRLPDEVIFKNGKTTLLFSVNNDGKRPYVSYSSNTAKGDTFDKEFGLLITYLKYLKEDYKDVLKECFDFKGKARLSFIYGVVRQLCDNHNISIEDLQQFSIHVLNNERYTLKQYNDWKREIENKAKRYIEVTNKIENKEKELEKLKKQKESLK